MEQAIGVIDSGVGGLTVAYELMRQLPNEQIFYLGDTLRCPYGSRAEHEVIRFTLEMVNFLMDKNIKMIVIACNTATAFTLDILKETLPIPVIGVIRPGARAAIKATKTNRIGVIGTEGTIKSRAYPNTLNSINRHLYVSSLACPTFVPIVEKGLQHRKETKRIVHDALQPFKSYRNIDTLILGCTHYPLLEPTISEVMGPKVKIISSSEETARETSALLEFHQLLNKTERISGHHFYTTGNLTLFKQISSSIFNVDIQMVQSVFIEKATI